MLIRNSLGELSNIKPFIALVWSLGILEHRIVIIEAIDVNPDTHGSFPLKK